MNVTEEEAAGLMRNRFPTIEQVMSLPGTRRPLASFTIQGKPSNAKNSSFMSWPSIFTLGLSLGPKRPIRGLKDFLFYLSSMLGRRQVEEARHLLEIGSSTFHPVKQRSTPWKNFAKRARQELLTHLEIRRPLVSGEQTLRVDASFYLATGRPGALDEPGLWEALFDAIEDADIIANDYRLQIGSGVDGKPVRIWPPKGRSKAALAERKAWNPRTEVRIYPGEPRQFGEPKT